MSVAVYRLLLTCATSIFATGTSSNTNPITPTINPITFVLVSSSANKMDANTATLSGCESIMTDPNPAVVRYNPSAKKYWNPAASINPNAITHAHPIRESGNFLFWYNEYKTTTTPAGKIRNPAISSGLNFNSKSFMTAMLVPQKKNGLIKNAMDSKFCKLNVSKTFSYTSCGFYLLPIYY